LRKRTFAIYKSAKSKSFIEFQALGSSERLYFDLSDPQSGGNKSMDSMFKFLASKETGDVRPLIVRIKGRDVSFRKTCGRIADCTFEELCERPLWTSDYLKMTQVRKNSASKQIFLTPDRFFL